MHEIKKKIDITHLVCKLWVRKVQKHSNSLFSENATSGNATFTKFCMIINIEVRLTLKISDRYLKDLLFQRTICKMPEKPGL